MKKIIVAKDAPPTGAAPLSHAVLANGLLFTSGQINLDRNMKLVGATTKEKTDQTMLNLKSILGAEGLTFADVVKTTIYVTDMAIYVELNEAYAEYFEKDFPAREVVCVKELPLGASLEISMVATKSLELRNKSDQHRRSVETLGLSGHGDSSNVAKKTRKVKIGRSKRGKK